MTTLFQIKGTAHYQKILARLEDLGYSIAELSLTTPEYLEITQGRVRHRAWWWMVNNIDQTAITNDKIIFDGTIRPLLIKALWKASPLKNKSSPTFKKLINTIDSTSLDHLLDAFRYSCTPKNHSWVIEDIMRIEREGPFKDWTSTGTKDMEEDTQTFLDYLKTLKPSKKEEGISEKELTKEVDKVCKRIVTDENQHKIRHTQHTKGIRKVRKRCAELETEVIQLKEAYNKLSKTFKKLKSRFN